MGGRLRLRFGLAVLSRFSVTHFVLLVADILALRGPRCWEWTIGGIRGSTILTEMMADELNFLWSEIRNCIAEADAD